MRLSSEEVEEYAQATGEARLRQAMSHQEMSSSVAATELYANAHVRHASQQAEEKERQDVVFREPQPRTALPARPAPRRRPVPFAYAATLALR